MWISRASPPSRGSTCLLIAAGRRWRWKTFYLVIFFSWSPYYRLPEELHQMAPPSHQLGPVFSHVSSLHQDWDSNWMWSNTNKSPVGWCSSPHPHSTDSLFYSRCESICTQGQAHLETRPSMSWHNRCLLQLAWCFVRATWWKSAGRRLSSWAVPTGVGKRLWIRPAFGP